MKFVLALDLEGTLISNAVSQFPRPGLYEFLEQAQTLFARIVVFTAVRESVFREVAKSLVVSHAAPEWFERLEYVRWTGSKKDMRFVKDSKLENIILVDDCEDYVREDQKAHWISIAHFDFPYSPDDRELERILGILISIRKV